MIPELARSAAMDGPALRMLLLCRAVAQEAWAGFFAGGGGGKGCEVGGGERKLFFLFGGMLVCKGHIISKGTQAGEGKCPELGWGPRKEQRVWPPHCLPCRRVSQSRQKKVKGPRAGRGGAGLAWPWPGRSPSPSPAQPSLSAAAGARRGRAGQTHPWRNMSSWKKCAQTCLGNPGLGSSLAWLQGQKESESAWLGCGRAGEPPKAWGEGAGRLGVSLLVPALGTNLYRGARVPEKTCPVQTRDFGGGGGPRLPSEEKQQLSTNLVKPTFRYVLLQYDETTLLAIAAASPGGFSDV